MQRTMIREIALILTALWLAGCSNPPAEPDYRTDEQRRNADKAQQELSREIKHY